MRNSTEDAEALYLLGNSGQCMLQVSGNCTVQVEKFKVPWCGIQKVTEQGG